ncbi:MAG: hypothetical protein GXW99_06615 [Clostridiales bacterium]|nr:hypothetical protein [Clostridiales bacterium]
MDKELRRHYTQIVDFLGRILGPDYEIALHELKDDSNEIVALSGGELTGRHLGSPLSNRTLEFVTSRLYESRNYVLRFQTSSASGRKLCSNTMFIKGKNDELAGLLCINFDASRYQELASRVLELCGGMEPAEQEGLPIEDTSADETLREYPKSITGATASIVAEVIAAYPVSGNRLTQEEKMEIMDTLNRKGVFLLKGAVSYVAKELQSSEASIYRYLGKLNHKKLSPND